MTIYPSILTDSLELAQQQIDRVRDATFPVQFDIVDGEFADNMTFSPIDVLSLDLHGLLCDFHLMTIDPIQDVTECKEILGVRTVIAQVERMSSQAAYIDHVKALGMRVGLSLDLYTPITAIEEQHFSSVDMIQLMAIHAGFQGQTFESHVLSKIEELSVLKREHHYTFEIVVDGGETPEIGKLCRKAGAEALTVGSALWKALDVHVVLEQFSMIS